MSTPRDYIEGKKKYNVEEEVPLEATPQAPIAPIRECA